MIYQVKTIIILKNFLLKIKIPWKFLSHFNQNKTKLSRVQIIIFSSKFCFYDFNFC